LKSVRLKVTGFGFDFLGLDVGLVRGVVGVPHEGELLAGARRQSLRTEEGVALEKLLRSLARA
jgi:hypothetical protein